jgi:hypothetical protein
MESNHLRTIGHGLLLVSAMLALIAAALWFKTDPVEPQAQAQGRLTAPRDDGGVPDSGKQRLQLVEQLEALNRRMADIERGFRDGSFVIQTVESKGAQKSPAKE